MFKHLVRVGLLSTVVLAAFTSCEDEQQFTNEKLDAKRVEVQVLNSELAKVLLALNKDSAVVLKRAGVVDLSGF